MNTVISKSGEVSVYLCSSNSSVVREDFKTLELGLHEIDEETYEQIM